MNSPKKVSAFSAQVYALCRRIPQGRITTYKELARALGKKGQVYRAIGHVLRENPFAPEVPCHRVVKSSGALGGFRGKIKGKEVQEKARLLEKEGIRIINGKVNLQKYLFRF